MKPLFYILFFSCFLQSCTPSVKGILNSLGQKNYSKAKLLLDKRQEKNPQDVGSLYAYTLYFSDSSNSNFDIDNAYQKIQLAEQMYHLSSPRELAQLQKRHINASSLLSLKTVLEKKAFNYFKKINTETSFQEFINRFAQAPQILEAIERRNFLAFAQAQKQNTYSAYKLFFEKYPDAQQVSEAKKKYEDLLFATKTKDGSLASFVQFLEQHPKTPYRKLVERKIYELAILSYSIWEYENFVKNHPQNPYLHRALQWIWYMSPNKNNFIKKYSQLIDNQLFTNKLRLQNSVLFPKEKESKLVFEDNTGKTQVFTQVNFEMYQNFNPQKQLFDGDIYVFKNSLNELMAIDKLGQEIVGKQNQSEYNSIKILHSALLKVRKGDKYAIFHKGGFQVSEFEFEEIDFINDEVLKFKKNNRWGLISPNNKVILNESQQRISIFANNYLKIERGNDIGFALLENFNYINNQSKKNSSRFYFYTKNSFSITHKQYLKIRRNNRYGIMNPVGKTILQANSEKILETPTGWASYSHNQWQFYNFLGKKVFADQLEALKINAPNKSLTYAVRKSSNWAILDAQFRQKTGFSYDKIDFIPHAAILENQAGKFLYLGKKKANKYIPIKNYSAVKVFAFKNQNLIVVQDSTNQKGLLNQEGEVLFECQYQDLLALNSSLILFEQNNKKGLITLDSTVILPAHYDAIANTQEGYFSLFRNGKLGLFDVKNRKLIPCYYSALVQVLDSKKGVLIAKKAKFALINSNNQLISSFIFDEIHEWKGDLVKVRHQNQWKYYNFVSKKFSRVEE